jgi:AcrR family transcriptional regulator
MAQMDRPHDEIADRILTAARSLLVHYGYDKTTMNDIAHEAGVSKSTIYVRWNKKEDLFQTLLLHESRRLILDWFDRIEADPDGGTYANFMRHALAALFDNSFLRAIYGRDRHMLGTLLARMGLVQLFQRRMAFFEGFFKAMQSAGVVRTDVDAHTLTYLLNATHFGLLQFNEILPDETIPPMDATFDLLVDMIDRTVSPPGGGDSDAGKAVIRQYRQAMLDAIDAAYQPDVQERSD